MHFPVRRAGGAFLAAFALTATPAAAAVVPNSAPVCFGEITAVDPGGARTFSLHCGDRDFRPQPLSVEIVDEPDHGELTVAHGARVRYVPAAGHTGADSFTFRATDGADETAVTTHQIQVTAANLAPRCHAQQVEAVGGFADFSRPGFGSPCYDPNEGDAAVPIVEDEPVHGRIDLNQFGHHVRYSTESYRGPDSFSLKASDGALTGPVAEFAVQSVDLEPPVCEAPDVIPVRTDTAKSPELYCQDNSFSPGGVHMFNWQVVDSPDHGTWGGGYVGRTYTPAEGYTGPDELQLKIGNGAGYSDPVTVRFQVADDANTPPRCSGWPVPFVIRSGATKNAPISCWDAEGDPLEKTLLPEPEHGRLSESTSGPFPTTLYTADDNYAGPDHYGVSASDGRTTASMVADIDIVGDDENTVPECLPATVWTYGGREVGIGVPCQDREGDPMTFAILDQPEGGTASPAPGPFPGSASFKYTPPDDFSGITKMTIRADDGRGQTRPISVLIEVKPRTAPTCPTVDPRQVRTNANEVHFHVPCVNNGEYLYPAIHAAPAHGTLTAGNHGDYFYKPDTDFQGDDSFTLRAENDKGIVDVVVQIVVSDDANQLPSCNPSWESTTRQGQPPLTLHVSCYDPDSDPLTVETVDGPVHGTLGAWDQDAKSIAYTPADGYVGEDEFTFRATDGRGHSATVTQRVRVRGADENSPPQCQGRHIWVAADQPTSTWADCRDPDGDPITVAIATEPEHGTVTAPNQWREFTYTPEAGFEGTDEIGITATDDRGTTSEVATITVHVGVTSYPPIVPSCSSFAANVEAGSSRRVQLRCQAGPFQEGVSAEVVDQPKHGTLGALATDGWITYTPAAGFTGVDTFTYRGTYEGETSPLATIELHVNPPAPPGEDPPPEPPPAPRNDPPPPPPGGGTPPDPFEQAAEQRLGGDAVPLGGMDLGGTRAFVPAGAGGGVLNVDAPREKLLALVCPTACDIGAGQQITLAGAGAGARAAAKRKPIRLRTQRLKLRAGQAGLVHLRLTKAQRRRIRRARRATLTVKVVVRDASGKVVRDTARFRLKARWPRNA